MLVCVGFGLSMLLSFNRAPQPSVYNEVASIGFFGLLSANAASLFSSSPRAALRTAWPAWLPLILLAATACISALGGAMPGGLTLSYLGTLAAAALLVITGALFRQSTESRDIIRNVLLAIALVGLVNAGIAFIQTFHPPTADGGLIAMSHSPGRAVGNLRQPNQLASLLLWSIAACVVWLDHRPRLRVPIMSAIALLAMADALTASRTGAIGLLLLVAWGIFGVRLSKPSRLALVTSPVFYGIGLAAARMWGAVDANDLARVALHDDATTHRIEIWREAISLILQNPLSGVGFGQFNFAWTLTPFPNRPGELFDNVHDIVLQLAVEIGLPLTLAIVACLAFAAVKIIQQWRRPQFSVELAAVAMMLAIIFLHSLLEFPLWYPHFLMPTCLLAGWAVSGERPVEAGDAPLRKRRWMAVPGLVCAVLAVAALLDYQRVSALYDKDNVDIPMQGRLMVAGKSVLFAYHADYALATLTQQPSLTTPEIGRVAHVMLDPRLMLAWVKALQERHDMERARYLVERIREFRGLDSPFYKDFLAGCDAAPKTADNPCLPSTKPLTWRDFRDYPLR